MAGAPFRTALLTAVTTGTSQAIDVSSCEALVLRLFSTGTTSGGTIIFEEAEWDELTQQPYTGTWSQIASIAASSFTGTASTMYHVSPNCFDNVRVRISSDITGGGTITASLRGR